MNDVQKQTDIITMCSMFWSISLITRVHVLITVPNLMYGQCSHNALPDGIFLPNVQVCVDSSR